MDYSTSLSTGLRYLRAYCSLLRELFARSLNRQHFLDTRSTMPARCRFRAGWIRDHRSRRNNYLAGLSPEPSLQPLSGLAGTAGSRKIREPGGSAPRDLSRTAMLTFREPKPALNVFKRCQFMYVYIAAAATGAVPSQ